MKEEGSEMLALKLENGTVYQGMQVASESCRGKKIDCDLEPLGRNTFCPRVPLGPMP